MSNIVLTETQLKKRMTQIYSEEYIGVVNEKWDGLNNDEKQFVLEFISIIHPSKKNIISEARWYNLVGDLVGLIPGMGFVDVLNGISYWKQGDKFFSLLSFISALPAGDVFAKPVIGLMKGGSAVGRLFKESMIAGDAVKMGQLAAGSSILGRLVGGVSGWGAKLLNIIRNFAGRSRIFRGIEQGLEKIVNLFGGAKRNMQAGSLINGKKSSFVPGSKIPDGNLNPSPSNIGANQGPNDQVSAAIQSILGK